MDTKIKKKVGSNYCWLIVLACCGMVAGATGICINTDGVFYASISEKFGAGRGTVALYTTFSGLATGISLPFVVKIMNRVKIQMLMRAGVILTSCAIALTALAGNLGNFYALAVLRGLGCAAFSAITANIVVGRWFVKKRSMVVGGIVCFAGLVGAVSNIVFSHIIENYGYQAAYAAGAVAILAMGLPGTFIVRLSPEEMGLKAYGDDGTSMGAVGAWKTNYPVFKTVSVLYLFVLVTVGSFFAVTTINAHLPGYGISLGIPATTAASLSAAALTGSVISKAAMGVMCEKTGVAPSITLVQSINIAALFLLIILKDNVTFLICASFGFGFVYGNAHVAVSELIRAVYGNDQFENAYSKVALAGNCSTAVSVAFIGFVYDATGSYPLIFAGGMALDFLSIVLIAVISRMFTRSTGRSLFGNRYISSHERKEARS